MTLLALADDITGAADAAAYAHAANWVSAVHFSVSRNLPSAGFHAVSSDSRGLSAAAARARVRDIVDALGCAPGVIWCKKIDSLLRGNLGAEIEIMLDRLDAPCAVITPTLPAMGRCMVEGRLTGAPEAPSLGARLAEQTLLPTGRILLDSVRAGGEGLVAAIADTFRSGAVLLLADSETTEDLDRIVAAAAAALPGALLCGSGAVVGAVARGIGMFNAGVPPALTDPPPGPVLVVVGSASEMARIQIAATAASGIECFEVGRDPIPDTALDDLLLCLPKVDALPPPHQARRAAEMLSQAAMDVLARTHGQRLVIAGGDTAAALLERLGVETMMVVDEAQAGMPLLEGRGADGRNWRLILKAGSHGESRTLVELMTVLREGRPERG